MTLVDTEFLAQSREETQAVWQKAQVPHSQNNKIKINKT